MPLKLPQEGVYVISSDEGLTDALELLRDLKQELLALEEMQRDATALSKAIGTYMIEHDEKRTSARGIKATVVQTTSKHIVASRSDITGKTPIGIVPLDELVERKVFQKLTRRVADEEKITKAINDGLVELDTIAKAFYEVKNSPYVRTTLT
jgi:hypothetical protein